MDFNQLATQMSKEVYQQLKNAVELGRWADGRLLNEQQKQISLQAILRYEIEHLPREQWSGHIPPKKGLLKPNGPKTEGGCHSNTKISQQSEDQPLRWQD